MTLFSVTPHRLSRQPRRLKQSDHALSESRKRSAESSHEWAQHLLSKFTILPSTCNYCRILRSLLMRRKTIQYCPRLGWPKNLSTYRRSTWTEQMRVSSDVTYAPSLRLFRVVETRLFVRVWCTLADMNVC